MSTYFIAGAGTDIGKTFTTCALIEAAKRQGRAVAAFKPVITGFDPDDAQSDTALLIDALDGGTVEEISPWRYRMPLSPEMAAQLEGPPLGLAQMDAWVAQVKDRAALTLIETAGGVMVPLNAQATTRDWMREAGLPVVLVVGSYLGAISHALSAVEALHAAEIPIAAMVVNQSQQGPDLIATCESIRRHAHGVGHIVAQRRVQHPKDATAVHALLEELA
jgi:dethiobiotin synthetase